MSYKKLKIWQKGMELVVDIYDLTKVFPKEEIYGLTSQMRRSAVSIPSNIAEGSQRTSDREFAHFILIAKGSVAELETQVLVAQSLRDASEDRIRKTLNQIEELSRMMHAFHSKLTAQDS